MDKLMEILMEINPEITPDNREELLDRHLLDSMGILALVAELEEQFGITVPAPEIIPDNFQTAEAIWKMICRLREEEK